MAARKQTLARVMARCGVVSLLERLPVRPGLLVLNYHRIGDPAECLFDRGVFSATAAQFEEQVQWLKRRFHVATSDEVEDFLIRGRRVRDPLVAITFDDGYRDNFVNAFPVLRANGLQGTFFLVTSYLGSSELPWWDKVAFWVRHTKLQLIRLSYPRAVEIRATVGDRSDAVKVVLDLLKSPEVREPERFLRELGQACEVPLPTGDDARVFMSWEEAEAMQRGGMHIGSHTQTHQLLAKLEPSLQRAELEGSRVILESRLRTKIGWLAYPVGGRHAFNRNSQCIARECGYDLGFSYYGGLNRPGQDRFDVLRASVELMHDADWFRWRAAVAIHTGDTTF